MWYSGVLDNTKSWDFEYILINVVGGLYTGGLSNTLVKYQIFVKRKKFSNGKSPCPT